ncbi:helix-turn-helix domain-containing protein [Neorhizobium sp. LMR1-1-1.1]
MDINARLRDENATLREKVRQLEEALNPGISAPAGCHLTPSELAIFRHLCLGEITNRAQLRGLLYADRRAAPCSYNILDVFMSHLRQKIAPHGFAIETIWGRGWKLVRNQAEAS